MEEIEEQSGIRFGSLVRTRAPPVPGSSPVAHHGHIWPAPALPENATRAAAEVAAPQYIIAWVAARCQIRAAFRERDAHANLLQNRYFGLPPVPGATRAKLGAVLRAAPDSRVFGRWRRIRGLHTGFDPGDVELGWCCGEDDFPEVGIVPEYRSDQAWGQVGPLEVVEQDVLASL